VRSHVRNWVVKGLVGGLVIGAGVVALRARAAGIPAADALTYTGYLETPEGKPVDTSVQIGVAVWDSASGGKKRCEAGGEKVTPVAGRFQISLPEACSDAVKAQPDLWLETTVDGTGLGRTKLGAVPFAIEAAHATSADSAAQADAAASASGDLEKRLVSVENSADASSKRLDAARTSTLRKVDDAVDIEVSSIEDYTWVSGTEPTELEPGRYWVQTGATITAGGTGCTGTCKQYALVKFAPCVRVANKLDQVGYTTYLDPPNNPTHQLSGAAADSFTITKVTPAAQFGLCAARLPGEPGAYNARFRHVLTNVMVQPD